MIENPFPRDWRDLQSGVCRIFNEIGLNAEIERTLSTPRGRTTVDVYAVDPRSIDKITYIVECKNWQQAVSQHVVHAFTTVMHECGGNLGFIVSQKGLQPGAQEYLRSTNISGMSYLELQRRYFDAWWHQYFVRRIGEAGDPLIQYTEPINSYRERLIEGMPKERQGRIRELQDTYGAFGVAAAFFQFPQYAQGFAVNTPADIEMVKDGLSRLGPEFSFSSIYFRDLCDEIILKIGAVTDQFHEAFGREVFKPGR